MNRAMRRAKKSKKGDGIIQATPRFDRGDLLSKKMRTTKAIGHIKTAELNDE
jgi:hypothetical protein